MNEYKTSVEAAQALGISRGRLLAWLSENPAFRPMTRSGVAGQHGVLFWTDDEIKRAGEERSKLKKRKK